MTPEAFWASATRPDQGCWEWQGSKNRGYGTFSRNGRSERAHRHAWILTYGEIPPGLMVCHHCDNPPCIRPEHLFIGTMLDNMRDAARKGRIRTPLQRGERPWNASITHCRSGHELAGPNVLVDRRGHRVCRACRRRYQAASPRSPRKTELQRQRRALAPRPEAQP
jgi:hypothetical protein